MRFLKIIAVIVSFLVVGPVLADEIPDELLALDLEKCTATCPEVNGKKVCEFLCKCSVDHFKEALDYDRYVSLTAEMSRRKISETNKLFLLDVGRRCEGQLDVNFPALKKEMLQGLPKAKEKPKG